MPPHGKLFTVSAPSGAGKTSLVAALLEVTPGLTVSISHTTRARRPGEQDGVNYHFVDQQQFQQLVSENAFLEYAQVFNNFYGTTQQAVQQKLANGNDVILEIDWQGASQVRQVMPDAASIFILPPSSATLKERLTQRGQDDAEVIQHRLENARDEMLHYHEADYLVINDNFDQALADLIAIIAGERLKTERQKHVHAELIHELLSE